MKEAGTPNSVQFYLVLIAIDFSIESAPSSKAWEKFEKLESTKAMLCLPVSIKVESIDTALLL